MRRIGIGVFLSLAVLLLIGPTTQVWALGVGDKAPDFTLAATTQEKWTLSELKGKKNVLLFAFVGAFTPT
jgi:cytochrome oxidase Cu insertion factor (SCO1/SenC/PrrC family)